MTTTIKKSMQDLEKKVTELEKWPEKLPDPKGLLATGARLKFNNPEFLDSKKINDLDQILFEYQVALEELKDLLEKIAQEVLMFRATNGELRNTITLLASASSLLANALPNSQKKGKKGKGL